MQGDIIELVNVLGDSIARYRYDAWGNIIYQYDSGLGIADINPYRYRGYCFDIETGLYYLNARYYDSNIGRFISSDSISYLDPSSEAGLNLFAYCNNNPVLNVDLSGHFWDIVLDVVFIVWDVYNLCVNDGYTDWTNWASLVVDIVFAVIPFVTGGGGQVIKLANVSDDISDFSKITVIGENITRIENVSQFVNATDNLYNGFKLYDKLFDLGKGGKILAGIGGKTSNAVWLYSKLRSGYKVIDIGIDSTRVVRSSSYILEKTIIGIWKTRNIWKLFHHFDF